MRLVLASQSPVRKELLHKICFPPDLIISTDINEDPLKKEKPRELAFRLAREKADAAISILQKRNEELCILTADTVVSVGRRILPKAITDEDVRSNLQLLSDRNNRVYTGFCVIRINAKGEILSKTHKVEVTRVKFKPLSNVDIEGMVLSKSGIGASGGYTIDGFASSLIIKIIGSSSNVCGLPLYRIRNALLSAGLVQKNYSCS